MDVTNDALGVQLFKEFMQYPGAFFQIRRRVEPIDALFRPAQDAGPIAQMGEKVAADMADPLALDAEGDELAGVPAVTGTDVVQVAHARGQYRIEVIVWMK